MKRKIKIIDLFAGIGGIRMGFELTGGFETVFANDFDIYCKKTYDLNFDDPKLLVEDINKLEIKDLPEFDFLVGGFPCQPFSIAGYRQGFQDKKDRGNLFFRIADILKERKPLGFMLENVKNLKSHDNGNTYKIIYETLVSLGYEVETKILNTMEYGNLPQNRERIFIVGFLKEKNIMKNFSFPEKIPLDIKIQNLLESSENINEKYYYNGKPLYEKLKDGVNKKNTVYQWRRQYVRENKSGVCPTLTANMGMGGHNVPLIKDDFGIRKLTPKECFLFQGYPENYILPNLANSKLYMQAGNSVTTTLIERISNEIINVL